MPNRIRSIRAIQLGTEKTFELSAPLFIDATGDGVLGYRAGADFRWGREGRDEYNESLAPEKPDEKVMGNTLFFRAVDTYRLFSREELFEIAFRDGLREILAALRNAEALDPEAQAYPRLKLRDDATAIAFMVEGQSIP